MTYVASKLQREQRGFTLIELTVTLAISSILMIGMVAIVAAIVRVPVKITSELKASHQVQKATLIVTEDANVAQSFTSGVEPDYGTFTWHEFSGTTPIAVSAQYYWDNEEVLRVLDRDGEVSPPQVVIEGVLQYSDVEFQYTEPAWSYNNSTKEWSYSEGKVTVSMTSTHDAGAEFPDTVITAAILSNTRPEIDLPAPLPGRLAPATPPANQVNFTISGDPTILIGSYVSGSGTDMRFDDSNYYTVSWSGNPRTVSWEATSEAIDYTEITNITVEFTGYVNRSGVSQELYVYDPDDTEHTAGGYATSPDTADVYPSSNVDKTVSFELSQTDVDYINSLPTKVIKIKLVASDSSTFRLFADKLVFKVAGTPSGSFSRDFYLDTDATLEVGSYNSGDYTSMAIDDTDYYSIQLSSGVVQWSAVSEGINLDTVSSVQVRFIGRVTTTGVVQQIFVFNPANGGDGYAATPDSEFTYTSSNTDELVTFYLSAADLSYVTSLFPYEVRIRVKTTQASGNWQLNADQLTFRVQP